MLMTVEELVYTWAPLPNELTYTAPENVFSSTTTVIKGQGNVASLRESHEKSEGRYRSRIQAEANRFFSAGRVFAMLWSDPTYGKSQESPTHGYNVTYAIPGQIRDRDQLERSSDALADYCAKHNFLSGKYATELGLSTNLHEATTITIGSGKKIKTLGTATTQFSFRGEQKVYDLIFHVLPNCVRDVVLGKPFLRATRTLQDARKFASRIVKKTGSMLMRHEFYFLGDSAPTFTGSINGIHSKALADCGSSVLVMDQDHALSLGLHVDRSSQTRLLFADGSSKYTTGVTQGVRWQFGPELDAEEHYLDFHILENAPAPVVLSDTFLFDTQAYSKYDCYLLDDGDEALLDEDDDGFFCHITVDDTYDPQGKHQTNSWPPTKVTPQQSTSTCHRRQTEGMQKHVFAVKTEP